MEVRTAESADVISETMRQILAARAIHNIFRMTESHLLVTCDCLKYEVVCLWETLVSMQEKVFDIDVCIFLFRLIDPQTQVTRLRVR